MRLQELFEDITSKDAIRNITDILTTQLPELYRQLSAMATKYADSNGEVGKGLRL